MHNIQLNCLFAKEKSAALIFLTLEAAFVKDFRMKAVIIYLCLFSVLQAFDLNAFTQIPVNESSDSISNSLRRENEFFKTQLDLIDLGMKIIGKDPARRFGEMDRKNMKLHLSMTPVIIYALSTGFVGGLLGNGAFYTSSYRQTNTSSFQIAVKYTQKKQFLFPIQSSVWTTGNKYNLTGDWRFFNYPQDTYGIGGFTTLSDKYIVSYQYLRFYEYALRNVLPEIYAGIGYQLDYHWGITQAGITPGKITDFDKYGFNKVSSSSGLGLDLLYDSRKNSLNPEGGDWYVNLIFLQNVRSLGSSSNWNSLTLDLRKYIKLKNQNLLALWFYGVLTLSGNPPYLDLPGTGTDSYNNTGRGYEQDRYIGKKFLDAEAEWRFGITRDGLIGGVIFCNAESVSELASGRFEVIAPGIGAGIRLKFNKFSGTNACIDYGLGTGGSRAFAGNLGEVF
jgi:hypothetical protein